MTDYAKIRHDLHCHPETAGNEQFTHNTIIAHLQTLHPTKVYTHVGGWGVVAVWGTTSDKITAFRADTDALPFGHCCGHDGHTTVLLRFAEMVDEQKMNGIMLIWQPAEETGEGARAVLESGILQQYDIDAIYAMHNVPGYILGDIVICSDVTFAAASVGVVYTFEGRSTHASTPEYGVSPGLAISDLIRQFSKINRNDNIFRLATLICVRIGEPAFGTAAGSGEVMYTLRTFSDKEMETLIREAGKIADDIAKFYNLKLTREMRDPFRATVNDRGCMEIVSNSMPGRLITRPPFRWSEDFGEYLHHYRGAMFGIGSGTRHPELHNPTYDFPDELIEPAAQVFCNIAAQRAIS